MLLSTFDSSAFEAQAGEYESEASLGYKKTEGRRKKIEQGRVVPICNVSFWEAAAEGTPQV